MIRFYGYISSRMLSHDKVYIITRPCKTRSEAEKEFTKELKVIKENYKYFYFETYGNETGVLKMKGKELKKCFLILN